MNWLESLGYLGAFIGAVLEGEILLISFIQLGRMEVLNLQLVIGSFALGTLATDWFFFLAGRKKGQQLYEGRPRLQARIAQMDQILLKRKQLLLLSYRFIYGFRIVLPILFGVSSIPIRTFAVYSVVGNIVWISTFSLLGYYAAEWITSRLEWIQSNLIFIIPGLLIVAVIVGISIRYYKRID